MLKKSAYFRTVFRPYPPFYVSLIMAGSFEPKYYAPVMAKPFVIHNLIKSDGMLYYAKKEIEDCGRSAFALWHRPEKLKNTKYIFMERERALLRTARKDFFSYINAYEQYMPALILVFASDRFVADAVRAALQKKLSSQETEALMNTLNIPLNNNFYKQEEYDLLAAKDLTKHVKKYEWLLSRYGDVHPYTLAQARAHRATVHRTEFLRKWKEGKRNVRAAIMRAKKLLGHDKLLIDLMQFIVYYRTQRTDIMNRSAYVFVPILEATARSRGLSYQQALFCTKDELIRKPPPVSVLHKRIRDHSVVFEDGRLRVLTGKASEKIRAFVKEDVASVQQFSGTIASKGMVRGIARIFFLDKDFVKVKKGDILVTSMTTPQMVPIMKKAAAFVTDEGGITCHAAILSREMQKPCIIGTKIATRVLKDGDVVEVNANHGIVKVLKRA